MTHPSRRPSPAVPEVLDADGIDPIGDEEDEIDPDDEDDLDDDDDLEDADEDGTPDFRRHDDGVSDLRGSYEVWKVSQNR